MTVYVTEEWAKQLVFEGWGADLDFANMQWEQVPPGIHYYKIPFIGDCPAKWLNGFKIEEIDIRRWYDPANKEYTYIGYGPKSNTIVLGETIAA